MTALVTRVLLLLLAWAGPVAAQGVLLELRPQVGDTLRMRLDQQTEITASRSGGKPMTVTTSVRMYSRAIVLGVDGPISIILAVTDSMTIDSNDEHALALAQQARRGIEGRQVRLRLVPDGTVALAEGERGVAREVKDMVSIMPGSFPKEPIVVGDTWMREMPIPAAGGRVRARFRLDSLSRSGDLAFLSMKGTFDAPDDAGRDDAAAGSVTGTMVVNRKRGWLSESRFLIQMRSTMPASSRTNRPGMQFRTRITQLMRVLGDRRP
jgi:hypothetical protein